MWRLRFVKHLYSLRTQYFSEKFTFCIKMVDQYQSFTTLVNGNPTPNLETFTRIFKSSYKISESRIDVLFMVGIVFCANRIVEKILKIEKNSLPGKTFRKSLENWAPISRIILPHCILGNFVQYLNVIKIIELCRL